MEENLRLCPFSGMRPECLILLPIDNLSIITTRIAKYLSISRDAWEEWIYQQPYS